MCVEPRLGTLQTFSLWHADVEDQKSRIIYPTSLLSELQVGLNVFWVESGVEDRICVHIFPVSYLHIYQYDSEDCVDFKV